MSDPRPARDGETLSEASVPPEPPTLSASDTAQMVRMLGLERDEMRNGWWLPAEPGPVFCTSIPHAVAEWQRLFENDHERAVAALRAELADARAQGGFDLDAFSRENLARCESPTGFNHRLDSWSLSDWMTATLGELGEAANVAKKLNRVRDGIIGNDETAEDLRRKLASEIADAFIYLDLMAQSQGIRLREAVRRTFDAKSAKIGYRAARAASGEDASNEQAGRTQETDSNG